MKQLFDWVEIEGKTIKAACRGQKWRDDVRVLIFSDDTWLAFESAVSPYKTGIIEKLIDPKELARLGLISATDFEDILAKQQADCKARDLLQIKDLERQIAYLRGQT